MPIQINLSSIEGYSEMSNEDKLKALESYEFPDPDYSGYIKKEQFDKTASELAAAKKKLKERMSEEDLKAQKEKEEREDLENKYNALLREKEIATYKAKYLGMGYSEELATDTAEALVEGNTERVFENQKAHIKAVEKAARANTLKSTPRPTPGGEGSTSMTLEQLRQMSPQERYTFAVEHPDEYKDLYTQGGN